MMSDQFDPPLRASKRRKTATYGTERSIQKEKRSSLPNDISNLNSRVTRQRFEENDHDSAYGSKDDSFEEEEHSKITNAGEDVEESISNEQRAGVMSDASTGKKRGRKGKATKGNKSIDSHDTSPAGSATTKETATGIAESAGLRDPDDEDQQQTRSSGRSRRRPRRYSDDQLEPVVDEPLSVVQKKKKEHTISLPAEPESTPKGILTPSKRSKTGPRKSVAFDGDDKAVEAQFGFKDIGSSLKKKKAKEVERVVQDVDKSRDLEVYSNDPMDLDTAIAFELPPVDGLMEVQTEDDDLVALQLQSELESENNSNDDDPELLKMKAEVLSRLVSADSSPLVHLESQYEAVHTLLSSAITAGESNSLLLLGARGVGKTLILETALKDLNAKHKGDFHTVRLNGFSQTDDRLALREIWRQLGREMQVSEDETEEVSSYADTMASLLSLLSHPDEMDSGVQMTQGTRTSKSIIFVLDEFDLFTTHPRQTLLYNLFDIAQSRKAPIAVIGCSTRMDVIECLEKRVKSRYSHRWLHIPSAKNLSAFEDTVEKVLSLDVDGQMVIGLSEKELQWRSVWNDFVKSEFLPSKPIQTLVKRAFHSSKTIPDLLTSLYPVIASLQLTLPTSSTAPRTASILDGASFAATHLVEAASLVTFLPTLPTLHISLLTAAARLETIHHLQAINFNLVFTHYTELVARSRFQQTASGAVAVGGAGLRLWSKEVAGTAWEELVKYGIIVAVTGGAGKDGVEAVGGGENWNSKMYKVDVTLEEVEWAVKKKWRPTAAKQSAGEGAGDVIGKWCREI